MALRRLFFVYFQFSTVLNGILFTEFSTVACTRINGPTALDLLANIRPRFKIPRGTLTRYQQPQWEILYFFKYGTFPISSNYSPHFNRTGFLNKMRLMKVLWDMDNNGKIGQDFTNTNDLTENINSIENDYSWSSEKDDIDTMDNKFRRSKPKGRNLQSNEVFVPIVRKYRGLHPLLRINSWNPRITGTSKRADVYASAHENYPGDKGRIGEGAVERNARRKFQTQGWK